MQSLGSKQIPKRLRSRDASQSIPKRRIQGIHQQGPVHSDTTRPDLIESALLIDVIIRTIAMIVPAALVSTGQAIVDVLPTCTEIPAVDTV